ncbi:MAG: hypothetical protein ACRD0K_14605 [Egibacteraceae bacterium]
MLTRLAGVALVLVMLVSLALGSAGVAGATEAGGPAQQEPLPSFSEVGSQSDIAQEFLPPEYNEPSWFQWLLFPLLIIGIVATAAVLFAYLAWQPRFANDQKTKRRR